MERLCVGIPIAVKWVPTRENSEGSPGDVARAAVRSGSTGPLPIIPLSSNVSSNGCGIAWQLG